MRAIDVSIVAFLSLVWQIVFMIYEIIGLFMMVLIVYDLSTEYIKTERVHSDPGPHRGHSAVLLANDLARAGRRDRHADQDF